MDCLRLPRAADACSCALLPAPIVFAGEIPRKGSVEDSGRPVLIGYWKSDDEPEWPDPRDFVDASWSADERREVAEYLSNGTVVVHFRGLSPCRFCGQHNGHREFTDGTYQWPE